MKTKVSLNRHDCIIRYDRVILNQIKTSETKKAAKLRPSMLGVPKGIRTPVTAVKGRCPRPLDDGDTKTVSA